MKPLMLIILDGFGIGKDYKGNTVTNAKMPTLDRLKSICPTSTLEASGLAVGLPEGQMGNSEVGHLNIGAGRVIYQDLTRITKSIKDGDFYTNKEFLAATENVKEKNSSLHLMGLVSKGGVHSHLDHLLALVKLAKLEGVKNVYIHAILDGRDVPPDIGISDIKELEEKLAEIGIGEIASISGRYYAMDRDKRWERVQKYYDVVVNGEGEKFSSCEELISSNYKEEVFDEFVIPALVQKDGVAHTIADDDSVIFINFRPDRAREIVRALIDPEFIGFERKNVKNIYLTTMTQYDKTIPNAHVAFEETVPTNTIGEVVSSHGLKQLRIAETEKYAHVTFFLNGGREEPFEGEDRVLVPSPKVATYDLKPEMSAIEVTDNVLERLDMGYDLIILNFANPDMVGHTGVIPAAIKAVETVDSCLDKILNKLDKLGGAAIITADHGNCEVMLTDDGKPVTSHTTNLVPVFLYGAGEKKLNSGALCDLAPTLLDLMGIEQPKEMTGKSLIKEK